MTTCHVHFITEEAINFDGKLHFILKLLINEIENEYLTVISAIKDKNKKNKFENRVNIAFNNLKKGIEKSKDMLNKIKKELCDSLNTDNFDIVIKKMGLYIKILTMPVELETDELKYIIENLTQKSGLSDGILKDINTLRNPNKLSFDDEEKLKEKIMKDVNFSEADFNMVITGTSFGIVASMNKCFADIAKLSLE
ncbi:MAG: hypothetical protein VB076_11380 [Synergistaceae bacterium]|nr:hypothetical protein [Synergistaceae bacterium]